MAIHGVELVRLAFQRGLAAVYLVAFISALNQFRPLLGEHGLLPVKRFVERVPFREYPSVFYVHYSDRFFAALTWASIAVSGAALLGFTEGGSAWLSAGAWSFLWLSYLSIVNVGQSFYAFGWESMLLEAGFFAIFLGPAHLAPSLLPFFALRWMLFRTEFGAGIIKLRCDRCWRDLTCLYYHHETQPLPNPLSWYVHRLPKQALRAGVVFSHFVQLVAPFGLFFPEPVSSLAGTLIILHQLALIFGGNYSWLNWLTIVLALSAFDDAALRLALPLTLPHAVGHSALLQGATYAMTVLTLLLSVQPARNLLSRNQRMNYSYNPLHLVNAYGAFGSVTRERIEIVLEGAHDGDVKEWKEYGFKAKPGDPSRRPPLVAPYHLRLDWLMWFLPLGGRLRTRETWFVRLVARLLTGDAKTVKLFRTNPFPEGPPRWIRALTYRYEFTTPSERRATGAWWKRERLGEFLPPTTLAELADRHL